MKNDKLLRRWFAILLLALLAALVMSVQPAHAQARVATSPVIDGLEVNADAALAPGSTLEFTLRGTPNGTAQVQVPGSEVKVRLQERSRGVYTGSYTVRRGERGLTPASQIRSQLTVAGRTGQASFNFPPSFAAAQQAGTTATAAAGTRVDRFHAHPVDRLAPGTELKFVLDGTPGARASIQVPGLPLTIPMQEQTPGHYLASYTLRLQDAVSPGPVVATLRKGERIATAQLAEPMVAGAARPPATMGAAPASALSLQVTSPGPNAVIEASQAILQGRTAPGARVHVKVDAVPPSAPGRLSVAMPVVEQTVQADMNGNFSLDFGSRRFAPGTRFEVQMSAQQGAQTTAEQRLVLYQG